MRDELHGLRQTKFSFKDSVRFVGNCKEVKEKNQVPKERMRSAHCVRGTVCKPEMEQLPYAVSFRNTWPSPRVRTNPYECCSLTIEFFGTTPASDAIMSVLVGPSRARFRWPVLVSALAHSVILTAALSRFQITSAEKVSPFVPPTVHAVLVTPLLFPIKLTSQAVRDRMGRVTGLPTALPTAVSHPRLPRSTAVREITDVESWAAHVIGNPALGFAAPLTFSLAQPSRPVEIRVGDFGESISAPGSPHPGHGMRNGFMETGFGNGYGGQKQIDRQPVRIVWKPKPEYTEEARNKKIQGDVIVDLVFTAERQIVILRIVRTLGYGLDESAVQALSQMVFRPATQNGRPVDFQARARVEFRLIESVVEGDSYEEVH